MFHMEQIFEEEISLGLLRGLTARQSYDKGLFID
jgi:hypothetical protein